MSHAEYLSPIEDIIADAKAGRMFILVDDEGRENEGDLVIPAEKADATAINFMAKHGRGLICLALAPERVAELRLPLMAQHNASRHETAFTVSIEAREGVTTGISAADRAQTVKVAIDPAKGASDIGSPGHVFPLVAKSGGVLVRAGHTEAAVDIAKLAGLNPSGVICEIMNDDGTMARLPELVEFAKQHGIKIATIADLIAYRRRNERLVKRELETTFNSRWGGEWKLIVYSNQVEYAEHLALVKGDITPDAPTLVRVHALDVLSDVLADADLPPVRQHSMEIIAKEGKGVVVLIREPSRTSLSDRLKRREKEVEDGGRPEGRPSHQPAERRPIASEGARAGDNSLRDYGIGAQILLDLGVKDMILLSHGTPNVVGLEGYGLNIVGTKKPV